MAIADAQRVRRSCYLAAVAALAWALQLWVTGGFVLRAGGLRLSSRNPVTPLIVAAVFAAVATYLLLRSPPGSGRADLTWTSGQWRQVRTSATRVTSRMPWLRPDVFAAAAAILVQVLRLAGARPLWLDEEMIALNIRDQPFAALAGPLWMDQSAPPGWLFLQRGVLLLLGTSEIAVRLVPVLWSCLTFIACVRIGRRLGGGVAALLLVLLCACGQWIAHYTLELKHYSADVFFALVLPGLAVSVWTTTDARRRMRTIAAWWAAAVAGHWVSNGALLVAPACALVLFAAVSRKFGARDGMRFATLGMAWLASFGILYALSLRYSVGSAYLRAYWAPAMAPADATVGERLAWVAAQVEPFANVPAGSDLPWFFWAAVLGGAIAGGRILGTMLVLVILSAGVLAALRLAPLYERLALWVVPPLYLCLAILAARGIALLRSGYRASQWGLVTAGIAACVLAGPVIVNIVGRGWAYLDATRETDSNHLLDDRSAVEWVMARRKPGEPVLTTYFGLPAVWWYGGVSVAPPGMGARFLDGGRILHLAHAASAEDCRADALRQALGGHGRVLLYLGFRFDDIPEGFDDLLLDELERLGDVEEQAQFAGVGRTLAVRLHQGRSATRVPRPLAASRLPGCVTIRETTRW